MIKFKRLIAKDTFAYKFLDFSFDAGIHSIVGVNGSSKTSIFLALMQCLYNKNAKGTKVDEVNNSITKLPYEIEVEFTKGNKHYWIRNSKKTGKIEIKEDGRNIELKRIPDCLKQIEDIIGADYNSFADLVYQSPKSSINLLETNSDGERKRFINRILRLDELDYHLERMKAKEKELSSKSGRINALRNQIALFLASLSETKPELEEESTAEVEERVATLKGQVEKFSATALVLDSQIANAKAALKEAEASAQAVRALAEAEVKLSGLVLPARPEADYLKMAEVLATEISNAKVTKSNLTDQRARWEKAKETTVKIADIKAKLAVTQTPEYTIEFAEEQLGKIRTLKTKSEASLSAKEAERAALERSAKAGKCPTCGGGVGAGSFAEKIGQLTGQIEEDTALIEKCRNSLTKYELVQKTWLSINAQIRELERLEGNLDTQLDGAAISAAIEANEATLKELLEEQAEIQEALVAHREYRTSENEVNTLKAKVGSVADVAVLMSDLADLCHDKEDALEAVADYKASLASEESSLAALREHNALAKARKELNKQIEESNLTIRLQLEASRQELSEAETTLEHIKTWLGILGSKGYRVHKIEKFLRNFNLAVNKYSDMISCGRIRCYFYIDEDGEIQFNVTDGNKSIPYSGWSEGEKARVKLSCLFAVLEILEALGSGSFNVLCLDEIFSSLDLEGKEGLFRVLSHLQNKGKGIYTIAHSELALAMVYDSIISATKHEDGTTTIKQ